MRTPNTLLQQAIREAGCSYAQLAKDIRAVADESRCRRLRTNSSAVAHWVAGALPRDAAADCLTEALARRLGRPLTREQLGLEPPSGASVRDSWDATDPVDALITLGTSDIQRRDPEANARYCVAAAALPLDLRGRLAARRKAGRTYRNAGAGEIQAVKYVTQMFHGIDDRYGGAHGRSAAVQYLMSDVATLCRANFQNRMLHREMLSVAASLVQLLAWKAHDAGEYGLAQRYYLQAYRLTKEADNEQHGAFILYSLAQQNMERGHVTHSLTLADAALCRMRGRADPATNSLYAITRARALALHGRRREAVAEAARAARLAQSSHTVETPHWVAVWGSSGPVVDMHTATTAMSMSDWPTAEHHFAQASAHWRAKGLRRATAMSAAYTGIMQCRQGHLEQASETWQTALQAAEGVQSARIMEVVAQMRRELEPFRRRGARVAADFDERACEWLRTAPI
ncbi:hypothetical protein [Streptomyces wuyuanensis]|uniref:hypothetical protein n=1 Tax=Streptomyces wuyuanensis TaxID=1196353 RepID=UPI0036B81756